MSSIPKTIEPDVAFRLSSAEKKRLRDRRAQQNLRDKKLRHTVQLEEKVAYCERHHDDQGVQRLLQVIQGLRRDNEVLYSRQQQLRRFVRSWDVEPADTTGSSSTPSDASPRAQDPDTGKESLLQRQLRRSEAKIHLDGCKDPSGSSSCSPASMSCQEDVNSCPPWRLVPLNDDDFSSPNSLCPPWFLYPERIAASPDSPASPLDLLYGTKANPLADMVHTKLRRRPLRDPELLALGWIVYHLSKWIFSPNPAAYSLLPDFIKPVMDQMRIPHPMSLDFIVWPTVRQNMIKQWPLYRTQRDDFFGLFTCCVKVRWPWGEDILERNEENDLCIRRDFYETFMSEKGWGLTPEFLRTYPDVIAGMDVRSILYEVI